jgi:hypothetical protein
MLREFLEEDKIQPYNFNWFLEETTTIDWFSVLRDKPYPIGDTIEVFHHSIKEYPFYSVAQLIQ